MHFSSKTSEDVALIIASAPLPASDINTTLPLSVQQLPLNQFCMAVSNNFYPVFHRPLLQKKQSLYSSQPPPPNGSVTKMTMENNLLTIETEERNVSVYGANDILFTRYKCKSIIYINNLLFSCSSQLSLL